MYVGSLSPKKGLEVIKNTPYAMTVGNLQRESQPA